ncbi:uncharacterized protein LOC116984555 [Amblyraja radiata]|uniref:uncharacterized protein LOC116984555 n=1 Tax=Amblyraja radiata TaxID=386614 RepID=UPI001402F728|nr:uncharacterized protein LOC116984555 [Amblyraja radiata]
MLTINKIPTHQPAKLELHCQRVMEFPPAMTQNPGFQGNVYFEPLRIVKLSTETPVERLNKVSSTRSCPADESLLTRWTGHWYAENHSSQKNKSPISRSVGGFPRKLGSLRQLSILDKSAILSKNNQHISEDLTWISGLESLGSLRTGDPNSKPKKRSNCVINRYHKGLVCTTLKNTSVLPLVNASKYIACDTFALQQRFA